jgi:hypothetical protein
MILCERLSEARLSARLYTGIVANDLLQIPESSPTAKQLASLLNETDKTASVLEASIGGRTFMVSDLICVSGV